MGVASCYLLTKLKIKTVWMERCVVVTEDEKKGYSYARWWQDVAKKQ